MTAFLNLLRAELFLLRKRTATWVILGIWLVVTLLFAYVLPYASYRTGSLDFAENLDSMLPGALAQTIGEGMPFYGGALALILGVLVLGSEYGWNTWKTLLTQRPGRMPVFFAKLASLGVAMVVFVAGSFAMGAVASSIIALVEGTTISFPAVSTTLEAMVSGWLILAVWATAGVALAMLTRGTSLAIGIGILWGLALEGLLGAFIDRIDGLERLSDIMLRANGYSLVRAVNGNAVLSTDGPGAFSGPYVSGLQATAVLAIYLVAFTGLSAWLLRRRDIA
jgi:ABC-type transport system involved in multi-copper enzyme maturation permease subunit